MMAIVFSVKHKIIGSFWKVLKEEQGYMLPTVDSVHKCFFFPLCTHIKYRQQAACSGCVAPVVGRLCFVFQRK